MPYRDIPAPHDAATRRNTTAWIEWANDEDLFPSVTPIPEGACEVCFGAVGPLSQGGWWPTCLHCRGYRGILTGVVPVAYSLQDGLESLLHRYKDWEPHDQYRWMAFPLASVLRVFLQQHLVCIEQRYGAVGLATIVPGNEVARGFSPLRRVIERFNQWPVTWEPDALEKVRSGRPGRGVVEPSYYALAEGQNVQDMTVLVLDDTWTSGSTVASAAAVLRQAGAAAVVALTIGRQLHPGWGSSDELIAAAETRKFDPDRCVLCA